MRLITVAIHTYPYALQLKRRLEAAGIETALQNVNLEHPIVAPGVRVRIHEHDLTKALRIIEVPGSLTAADDTPESVYNPLAQVLVPTDLNEHSDNAARLGLSIAASHGTGVLFLHSYMSPSLTAPLPLSNELDFGRTETIADDMTVTQEAESRMHSFGKRIENEITEGVLPHAIFEMRVNEGLPEEAIQRTAKEIKPLLIVMGTRAAETKEREVVGSVTAEVLDSLRFPVLSVPGNCDIADSSQFRNVLFIALPDQQDILAMDLMTRLLVMSPGTNVMIMNLPSRRNPAPDTSALCNLVDYCSKNYPALNFSGVSVSADSMAQTISRLNNDNKVDLIVVPTRKRNVLTRIFNPTLAHRLLFRADIPMLAIPV